MGDNFFKKRRCNAGIYPANCPIFNIRINRIGYNKLSNLSVIMKK